MVSPNPNNPIPLRPGSKNDEPVSREKWLRYDLQRSLTEIFKIATALEVRNGHSADKGHLLRRIEGLMLRSVRVESK